MGGEMSEFTHPGFSVGRKVRGGAWARGDVVVRGVERETDSKMVPAG